MKHLKLFFALFAMLALGVGNAWAEKVTLNNLGAGLSSTSNSSVSTTKVGDYTLNYLQGKKQGSSILLAKGTNGGTSFISNKTPIPGAIKSVTVYINSGAAAKTTYHCAFSTTECTSKYTTGSTAVNITGGNSNKYTCSVANASYFCISLGNNNNGQVLNLEIEYTPASSGGSGETAASVPTFSVPEGTFYSPINVELSCETADAEIHYTLDGSTPSSTSEKYTTAIAISETTTVKAIAVKDGLTDSEVATATYIKGETVTSYDIDFETNALEAYVNWDFSNITIAKTITAKGGTYYGNTSGKASASIKTKEQIQYPGTLTFSVSKESTNTTASNWLVQVSENGSTWTDVKTLSATEMSKGVWKDHSVDLSGYENVYVQISYGSSTAVRAIDEISLAQGVAPVKYTLTIESPENGTLLVTNGGASVASGDQFKAGTSLVVTPAPATGYIFESLTVDGSAVELTDGTYTFNMPAADVTISATFKENEKPAATLTLSKNGKTEDIIGHKQGDKVELPSITSDCVKEFVGWSADANCAIKPEYKAGDEYTLAETAQILYAVFATVGTGGEATASVNMATYASANSWGSTSSDNQKQITINSDVKAVISEGGNSGKYYSDGVRIYQSESATVTISTTVGELKSVKFTFTNDKDGTLLYGSTKLTSNTAVAVNGTSAVFSVSDTHETENKGQIRFTAIEVVYTGGIAYSNYSTTCVAALAAPTFSVAEGTYTEAKSIELSATEGNIYYTLDGTEPTESSTEYTAAIALNECGTTTIKAIAINDESQSPVAIATYTINLPITNTAETAYTPVEAIAIIDGACDKTEEVFVKGVVVSTTGLNTEYGNYDKVVVKAVDDESATPTEFTFFRLFKAAEKTKFTESDEVIGVGDIITAKGKLTKYNTTYELAEGCYMVERVANVKLDAELAWNPETVTLTVGDAFTAPTLSNPHSVSGITYESSNEDVATVSAEGVIALVDDAVGTATITASFLGDATYKPAEVTCTIKVKPVQEECEGSDDFETLEVNSSYAATRTTTDGWKATNAAVAELEGYKFVIINGKTSTVGTITSPELNGGIGSIKIRYANTYNEDHGVSFRLDIKQNGEVVKTYTITHKTGVEEDIVYTELIENINIAGDFQMVFTNLSPSKSTSNKDRVSIGRLCWTGYEIPKYTITTTAENGTVIGAGIYEAGAEVTLTATPAFDYQFVKWSNESTENPLTITVTEDITLEAIFAEVAATEVKESGKFSISAHKTATFATGNLQYHIGDKKWRFAKQQYQYVGEQNIQLGHPDFTGWIDMLGYSADGKFGVNPSNADADYEEAFVDWGTLFPEEGWSTLSKEDWKYLLEKRTNAANLQQVAKVGDILGIMLFPDNWTLPEGCTPKEGTNHDPDDGVETKYDFISQNYTLEQWTKLEAAGAVFLPAAGRRTGGWGNTTLSENVPSGVLDADGHYKHFDNCNEYAYYWTSTKVGENVNYLINCRLVDKANDIYSVGAAHVDWAEKGRYGQSVRLAKVVYDKHTVTATAKNGTVTGAGEYTHGAEVTLTVNANEGYKFTNWSNGETANPYTFTVTEDVNLTANFEAVTVTPETYTRTVTNGNYGTICLPYASSSHTGAEFYEVSWLKEGTGLYLDQLAAGAQLEAGKPYIFKATATEITVTYTGTAVANPEAGANGLTGTFTDIAATAGSVLVDNYIIAQNQIWVAGAGNSLPANRAYIKKDGVPTNEQDKLPGRRRVCMGENTTTDIDNITNGEDTTIKVIENGQLVIIRNGEKFNAQGIKL